MLLILNKEMSLVTDYIWIHFWDHLIRFVSIRHQLIKEVPLHLFYTFLCRYKIA